MNIEELHDELTIVSQLVPKGTHAEVAKKVFISDSYLLQIRNKKNMITDSRENRKTMQKIINAYRTELNKRGVPIPNLSGVVVQKIIKSHADLIGLVEVFMRNYKKLGERIPEAEKSQKSKDVFKQAEEFIDDAKHLQVANNLIRLL